MVLNHNSMRLVWLVLLFSTCLCVPVKVTRTKVKKSGVLMKAKCTYKVEEKIPSAAFTISLDTAITKFKSRKVKVLSENGTDFHVENTKMIKPAKFVVVFQGVYPGDADTPEPSGTCSDLEIPTESTPAPSSTTTEKTTTVIISGTLTYSTPAIVSHSWNISTGTRFYAKCVFKVDTHYPPQTKYFNISMGEPVVDFEHYTGSFITPATGSSGSWFYITNRYDLHPPRMEYIFQATCPSFTIPDVLCQSELPADTTTTVVTTTGESTTQSTTQIPTQFSTQSQTQSTTQSSTQSTDQPTKSSTQSTSLSTESSTTSSAGTTSTPEPTIQSSSQPTTRQTTGTPITGDQGVDVQISNHWPVGTNMVRMHAKCVFSISQAYEADAFVVRLVFQTSTENYEDWSWNEVATSSTGMWYHRSNKHPLSSNTVTFEFQVSALGSAPPSGRCYANGGSGTPGTSPTAQTGSTASTTTIEMSTIPFNSTYNYADAISKSLLFFYAQRSGALPADNPVSWRGDSALGDKGDNNEDLTGGWYDAGDMVKFNFPMASTTTLLGLGMYRWPQAYESIGLTAAMLDTIKWPLDYFLKCWNGDTANPKYYAQVGDGGADHAYWGRPEDMTMARPAFSLTKDKPGSDVAAETAAAMAIGSKLFRATDSAYADKLLATAIQLYDFADTYRAKYSDSIPEASAYYRSWSGYQDELMFAATVLYNVTGDASYIAKARQAHVAGKYDMDSEKAWALSWDDKRIIAQMFMYDITGEQKYRDLVDRFLDRYRGENVPDKVTQTPQGLAWRDTWGPLRYAANAAFLALLAAESGIDTTANRQWARSQIDYMLGDNDNHFSYVVGIGTDYPRQPHHRAASCPLPPETCNWSNYNFNGPNPHDIVGALVGGPDAFDKYADERHNFQTNEVACDYNSGFQSALAGLVNLVNGNSGTVAPPITSQGTTQSPMTSDQSTSQPQTPTQQPETTTSLPEGVYDYEEVLEKSILFYRAQRSGDLPDVPASDPISWRKDSALYDGNDVGLDLRGGWYDAGDYVKFNLPISSAVAILSWGVATWKDAYEEADQYDEMLDCIKWPLDFFLKCWRNDTKEFYAQVGNGGIDHSWMGRPEDMTPSTVSRPAYKVTRNHGGSDVAGTVAAAFAAGSIAFKDEDPTYSAELLQAARDLYNFADRYREKYTVEVPDAGGFYASSSYSDELVYAAAMLYKATREAGYLTDAENKYQQFNFDYQTSWALDWDNKLMAAKLLLYEATGKSKYSRDVKTFLNQWRPGGQVQYTPGGLAFRSEWGTLRYTANVAFAAMMAADMGIDASSNINWARSQIDYMLGTNPRQSSYVVGFGNNPPRRPHHKSSTCQPYPAPCGWDQFNADVDNAHTLYGALVGGPDANDGYVDNRKDYVMAEVTCDYNAGFQSAVAGLIHFGANK